MKNYKTRWKKLLLVGCPVLLEQVPRLSRRILVKPAQARSVYRPACLQGLEWITAIGFARTKGKFHLLYFIYYHSFVISFFWFYTGAETSILRGAHLVIDAGEVRGFAGLWFLSPLCVFRVSLLNSGSKVGLCHRNIIFSF